MGFRYQLRGTDGDDVGEAEYAYEPGPGDVIHVGGATRMRVVSVIPAELVSEFVDRPAFGVLEVEDL